MYQLFKGVGIFLRGSVQSAQWSKFRNGSMGHRIELESLVDTTSVDIIFLGTEMTSEEKARLLCRFRVIMDAAWQQALKTTCPVQG